jgi:hypothetical protein
MYVGSRDALSKVNRFILHALQTDQKYLEADVLGGVCSLLSLLLSVFSLLFSSPPLLLPLSC